MRLAAQVACLAEEALASRDATVVAEFIAQAVARVLLEHVVPGRDDETEAFAHAFVSHTLARVEALAAAGTAMLRAMTADKPAGNC
jgi:hypothetical protein